MFFLSQKLNTGIGMQKVLQINNANDTELPTAITIMLASDKPKYYIFI